jgi:hypothetical protein
MQEISTPPPIAAGSVNLSPQPPVAQVDGGISVPTATPVMANGGETSSGTSFFKSINWLEFGFMVLGTTALLYTINYYKVQMEKTKLLNQRTARQLDELKMNLQSAMKGKYKEIA